MLYDSLNLRGDIHGPNTKRIDSKKFEKHANRMGESGDCRQIILRQSEKWACFTPSLAPVSAILKVSLMS